MADMSKRKRNMADDAQSPAAKRLSTGQPLTAPSVSYGTVDPTYGQRSAFPGLDDHNESLNAYDTDIELEDDATSDALSYLKDVRSEARSIPTLLVAARASSNENDGPDRSLYDNGIGDLRGWYKDGAYTAAPRQESSADPLEDQSSEQAQEVYYGLLMHRFNLLRKSLKRIPPASVLEKLDPDHGFLLSPATKNYRLWIWRLQNTDPILAQLAAMDKDTVLRLIKLILQRSLLRKGRDRAGAIGMIRTSMWIWGLLARLPDRGELSSEEVASVRDLGKEAVWAGMQVRGMDVESLGWQDERSEDEEPFGEEDAEDGEVEEGGFEDDEPPVPLHPDGHATISPDMSDTSQGLAAARARLLARLDEGVMESEPQAPSTLDENPSQQNSALHDGPGTSTRQHGENDGDTKGANEDHAKALLNIRATVNMIITVAGDMYGQRDLLQFRQKWDEEVNGELLGEGQ